MNIEVIEDAWERHSELVETIRCDMRGDETLMSRKDFEKAVAEVAANPWIPVTEKAHPDHGGQVLVTFTVDAISDPSVTSARFDCGRWSWASPYADRVRKDSDVIAWMPHPEPYRNQ